MLSRTTFNILKNRVLPLLATDEFKASSAADKVAAVQAAAAKNFDTRKISDVEIAAFVMLFELQTGKVKGGSPEHFALRTSLGIAEPVSAWPTPNPPTSYPALYATWKEQYEKALQAVSFLDFPSAKTPDTIAAAIRNELGIGGLEDFGDPRAIGPADITMKLLIDAATFHLINVYPTWFENGVLKAAVEDPRSRGELLAAEALQRYEHRRSLRKQSVEEKRAAEATAAEERRKAIIESLADSAPFKALLDSVSALSFAALKEFLGKDDGFAATVAQIVPAGSADQAIVDTLAAVKATVDLHLRELKPDWFRLNRRGQWVLRRGEPRVKGAGRSAKALASGVARLVAKYGREAVLAALG